MKKKIDCWENEIDLKQAIWGGHSDILTGTPRDGGAHPGSHRKNGASACTHRWDKIFRSRNVRCKYHNWRIDEAILLRNFHYAKQTIRDFRNN